MTTSEQMGQDARVAVSPADIEAYCRDGAVLLKGVLGDHSRHLLEAGVEEIFAAQIERQDVTLDDGTGRTVVRDYATLDSPSLKELLHEGTMSAVAAQLLQAPHAQLVLDQVFYKFPGPILPTPWHQDTAFLRVRGNDLIRLWTTCDHSPRNVTVQVVRGSHRWNVVYNAGSIKSAKAEQPYGDPQATVGESWLPPTPDVARHRESFDIMEWDVEPGDILAFQGNMLHGTEGNVISGRPRRAFAVMCGGPDLLCHNPGGKAFPSPGRKAGCVESDRFPPGAVLGEHEDAFPRL